MVKEKNNLFMLENLYNVRDLGQITTKFGTKTRRYKYIRGTAKGTMSDKEKKLTAYHEAGHAVVTYYLEGQDPVHQVSIIPRGLAGGYTLHIPTEDKNYSSKSDMQNDLVVLLGGRVAEQIAIGDISTGASNDIQRATKIARDMVTRFGMSDNLGPVAFGSGSDEVFLGRDYSHMRNYSEEIASAIDGEVKNFISAAYDKTYSILTEHKDKLELVAQKLLEVEKIDAQQFAELMGEATE